MATPLQIGGLINLEERSGSFLPELPYTNRGVIRQKEELSALIDWCQITIKEVPLEVVIEDVLRIPLELMTVTGYEKGIAGHEVVAIFDNIKVLKPTESMTTRKRLYSTYQAWAELMKDIGKVKLTMQPQKKSLQKVWEWLEKYVAPSLKLFAEVGKIEQRDYIGNLVANGEMNITQKQLYDDYIKARRLEERG